MASSQAKVSQGELAPRKDFTGERHWIMGRQQMHVYYEGRVQGVGFRYSVLMVARGFEVTGWIRNLADGRVELVAEGDKLEVCNFVAALEEEMRGYIVRPEKVISEATGEFPSFKIAF